MTRAAPARLLGLRDRGHLGAGAVADIALYRDAPNREAMFATPAVVLKDGAVVARDGRITATPVGGTFFVEPEYDRAIEKTLRRHWSQHGSIGFDTVPIGRDELCRCCNGGRLLPAACFASAG
jgi:formylmethanofuran dehydrogenase subunit A